MLCPVIWGFVKNCLMKWDHTSRSMEVNLATHVIKFKYMASSFLLGQMALLPVQRLVEGLHFSPTSLL